VDVAGEAPGAGGDLVVEVVQPPPGLRPQLLLRRDQTTVAAGAVLAPGKLGLQLRGLLVPQTLGGFSQGREVKGFVLVARGSGVCVSR
jgi:hypothetical protein